MAEDERKPRKVRKKKANTEDLADPKENLIEADNIKKSTKATFDLYLEQAQANVERDRKSPKKSKTKSKRKKDGEEVMLENLRNSNEFRKDKDEETQKRNIFDPDESKTKSNRKRDKSKKVTKSSAGSAGVTNQAFDAEPGLTSAADAPMTIDELQPSAKQKKKKQKAKAQADEEAETQFIETAEPLTEKSPKKRGSAKEKGKKKIEKKDEEEEEPVAEALEDDGQIVEVIVHRTDKLRANFLIQHPMVRIHFVDADTGLHVEKFDKSRAVTSFYETAKRDDAPAQILPVMTEAYDFKKMRSIIPWWDENIVFNECYNYLIREKPNVIIFFELLDFVSMNRASKNQQMSNVSKGEGGWHKEAWAFLKLRGANGHLNVNQQLRLQLYEVPRTKVNTDQVAVFQYWKNCVRRLYPSTMYITVKAIDSPSSVSPAPRSKFPTQEEEGTKTLKQIQETLSRTRAKVMEEIRPSQWTRLPSQACKLPNKPLLALPTGKQGCLTIKFSNDGRLIACGCQDKPSYPIKIYGIPDGELRFTLNGHYNNIYELAWSKTDKYLLSASSDGTARVWEVESKKCHKMMSHPTFVYCAKFHPRVNKVIVTGGYDNVIRVWQMEGEDLNAQLVQELDGHTSYVNSLCFDMEGGKLYSADGNGVINVTNVHVTEKATKKGVTRDWKMSNEPIEIEDLKDQNISCITLHPNGRRLLIHAKDNTLRMLDLRMKSVIQKYVGSLNFRQLVHSDITPCGSFVLSGSEDGCAYAWNADTGDQVADYPELNFTHAVNDVKFHPHDHIVAFSSHGDSNKVLIFKYEPNLPEADARKHFNPKPKMVIPAEEQTVSTPERGNDESLLETAALRKQKALKKLESMGEYTKSLAKQSMRYALESTTDPSLPLGTVNMNATGNSINTWDSTYDRRSIANDVKEQALGPTIMSPHAQKTSETEAMRSHLSSQMEYMKRSLSPSWRPGFSSIGTKGGRAPSMTLTLPSQENPNANFSVQGADDIRPIGEVVALYDYLAQRSDELSFRCNDVILVLHKDTDQWWMGVLKHTGTQGFFPSNYVERTDKSADNQVPNAEATSPRSSRKTTALVDKGRLMFLSGTESDASSGDMLDQSSRQRRRKRKKQASNDAHHSVFAGDRAAQSLSYDHLLQ